MLEGSAPGSFIIDLSQSYIIGDGENDIKAGKEAGCKTVLVNGKWTNDKGKNFGQDYTFESILEAINTLFTNLIQV
jgi:histidinol phosphatase-like enzyme